MFTSERRTLPPGMRYLRNACSLTKFRDTASVLNVWKVLATAAKDHFGAQGIEVLQEIAESRNQERRNIFRPNLFRDFVVLVGEQGSGKATLATEFERRGYSQITMSDVVRAVAPDLGFSPDTTQGKIDAGHAMRKYFGRSVLMKLCIVDAMEEQKEQIVVDGPRSMYEIRAAQTVGARIIGLIADISRKQDRAIRFDRVVNLRPLNEPKRRITSEEFYSRDRQEGSRSRRMLEIADKVVLTNRPAADLVDMLLPKKNRI